MKVYLDHPSKRPEENNARLSISCDVAVEKIENKLQTNQPKLQCSVAESLAFLNL